MDNAEKAQAPTERTVCVAVIPLSEIAKPRFDGRGRPNLGKNARNQKWFVSFKTSNPEVPRIEAWAFAPTREDAGQAVLALIGAPVLLSMDVD